MTPENFSINSSIVSNLGNEEIKEEIFEVIKKEKEFDFSSSFFLSHSKEKTPISYSSVLSDIIQINNNNKNIKTGILEMKNSSKKSFFNIKNWKNVNIILKENEVIVCNPKTKSTKEIIVLKEIKEVVECDDKERKSVFKISTHKNKEFFFSSKDSNERREWISLIDQTIKSLQK